MVTLMPKRKATYRQDAGIVSIMVTLIMMTVISLLVLGFAEISRNEQRNSLDDQLSTQAYYAAESGINDVRVIINQQLAAGQAVASGTICPTTAGGSPYAALPMTIDNSHGVAYTCEIINAAPHVISYTVSYAPTVVPVVSQGPAPFSQVTLTWSHADGAVSDLSTCPAAGVFPVATNWNCPFPVLRIDMVDATNMSRANWSGNTATMFFAPSNNAGASVSMKPNPPHGSITAADCTSGANGICTVTIKGLTDLGYYMRVSTLYGTKSKLTLTAPANMGFANAQAVIDSTGKAEDVLRRVVVAVDLTDANSHPVPSAAIITQDSLCKRFATAKGPAGGQSFFKSDYGPTFSPAQDTPDGEGDVNPFCTLTQSGGPPMPS